MHPPNCTWHELFSRNWSQLCLVQAELVKTMGPPTLQLGMRQCPLGDLLTSQGQKLHPQIMLSASMFWMCRGLELSYICTEQWLLFTAPFSNHLSPHPEAPHLPPGLRLPCCLVHYPVNTPGPCLGGGRSTTSFSASLHLCHANKLSLLQVSASQRFALLHVGQNELGSVTVFLKYIC